MRATSDKPTDPTARLEAARRQLGALVHASRAGGAETLREAYPDVWADDESALELVFAEYVARRDRGEEQDPETWYRRFPQWRDRLDRLFALFDLFRGEGRSAELPPGYELLDVIGQGSSAVVYKARQTSLDRVVAIKVLWAPDDERAVLRREAELAAKLEHPNIARVYEIGEWRGRPYLVMEYVGGGRVDAVCRSASHDRVAGLMEVLSRAVEHAHQQGVVHRDLKPANVLVAEERWHGPGDRPLPTIKIVDFGLAIPSEPVNRSLQTGGVAGTPSYMAPEQAEARVAEVGPRADVYSLGAMLYELLSGRPPFLGKSVMETLDLVRTADPVPPRQLLPTIPRDLETIALKCLRKEPDRRYASAQALADDLRRFLEGRPIVARPVSTWERLWKLARRRPAVGVLALTLTVATWTTIAALAAMYRQAETARLNDARLNEELRESFAGKSIAAARALWNGAQLGAMRRSLDECPPAYRDAEWRHLDQLCSAHVQCWSGPDYASARMAVSRDGQRLAARRRVGANKIDMRDASTGESRGALTTRLALQIEFSDDGRSLFIIQATALAPGGAISLQDIATDNIGREAVVFDLATLRQTRLWRLTGRGGAMSRGGKRFAAWDADVVRVWEGATGKIVAEFPEPAGSQRKAPQIAIDDDGRRLAIRLGSDDLRIWDIDTKVRTASIPAGPAILMGALQFHSGGKLLFGHAGKPGSPPGQSAQKPLLHAWNVESAAVEYAIPAEAPLAMAASPDGTLLALLVNRTIELHDARTGARRATLQGHADRVLSIAFSSDGRRLYSSGADDTLRTWDVSTWAE